MRDVLLDSECVSATLMWSFVWSDHWLNPIVPYPPPIQYHMHLLIIHSFLFHIHTPPLHLSITPLLVCPFLSFPPTLLPLTSLILYCTILWCSGIESWWRYRVQGEDGMSGAEWIAFKQLTYSYYNYHTDIS